MRRDHMDGGRWGNRDGYSSVGLVSPAQQPTVSGSCVELLPVDCDNLEVIMEIGDVVKWVEPQDAGEVSERYVVVEDRGDRVLVESTRLKHFAVRPTFVYMKTDLVAVND